jgi:hypothetical protein
MSGKYKRIGRHGKGKAIRLNNGLTDKTEIYSRTPKKVEKSCKNRDKNIFKKSIYLLDKGG